MDWTSGLLAHYDFQKAWLYVDAETGPRKDEDVRTDFVKDDFWPRNAGGVRPGIPADRG
jgi:hypothetical protein